MDTDKKTNTLYSEFKMNLKKDADSNINKDTEKTRQNHLPGVATNENVVRGAAVLSFAGILVKIISLIFIPALRWILDDTGQIKYSVALQIYIFAYVLTNSGFPVAISKFVSELRSVGNYKDAVKVMKISKFYLIIMGTVLCIVLIVFSTPIATAMKHRDSSLALIVLAPTLIFSCMTSSYRGFFQGSSNMMPTAISQIIEQIARVAVSLPLAYIFLKDGLKVSVAAATFGTTFGAFTTLLALHYMYRKSKAERSREFKRQNPDAKRLSYKELRNRVFIYAMPVTLCVGMQNLGALIDMANVKGRLLVLMPEGAADILQNHLVKAQQFINVPTAIALSLSAAVLPAIAAACARNDKKEIIEKINFGFKMCYILSFPFAMMFGVLSSQIYSFLHFGGGSIILTASAILIVLISTVNIQSSVLQGMSKLYTVTAFSLLGIILKISLNYFLVAIPQLNVYGAVIGSIVCYTTPIILSTILIKKTLKVKFSLLSHMVKPFVSSVIMGAVIFAFSNLFELIAYVVTANHSLNGIVSSLIALLNLSLSALIGMIIYLIVMAVTGGLRKSDLSSFPSKFVRLLPDKFMKLIR